MAEIEEKDKEETPVQDISPETTNEEIDTLTKSSGKGSKQGQELSFNKSLNAIEQKISLEKAGISNPQTFSVMENNDNVLISITKNNKNVATFKTDSNGVKLSVSKSFIDSIKSDEMDFSDYKTKDGYEFDISNLHMTKSGNIDSAQVSANGSSIAVMFSALGAVLRDSQNHTVKKSNIIEEPEFNYPYDISISTKFLENALNEENGCSMAKDEPLFSSILVSRLHLSRQLAGETAMEKPVDLSLPGNIHLDSIPVKTPNGIQYLSIIKNDNKKYIYLQTRDTAKRTTAPQLWEINDISLQKSGKKNGDREVLHFGLKSRNGEVRDILIDAKFAENEVAIKELSEVLSDKFQASAKLAKGKNSASSSIKIGETKYPVYPISAEAFAEVLSTNRVSNLSREAVPGNERTIQSEPQSTENSDSQSITDIIDTATNPTNTANQTADQPPISETLATDQQPTEEASMPISSAPEPQAQPNELEPQPNEPEIPVETKRPKKPIKENYEIKPPKRPFTFGMVILCAINILISVLVPIPIIGFLSTIFAFGALVNELAPWNWVKKAINASRDRRRDRLEIERQKIKDKIHDLQRKRSLDRQSLENSSEATNQNAKTSKKNSKKLHDPALEKEELQLRNTEKRKELEKRQNEIEEIKKNPLLTNKQKEKQLKNAQKGVTRLELEIAENENKIAQIDIETEAKELNTKIKEQEKFLDKLERVDSSNTKDDLKKLQRQAKQVKEADKQLMTHLQVTDNERTAISNAIGEDVKLNTINQTQLAELAKIRENNFQTAKAKFDEKSETLNSNSTKLETTKSELSQAQAQMRPLEEELAKANKELSSLRENLDKAISTKNGLMLGQTPDVIMSRRDKLNALDENIKKMRDSIPLAEANVKKCEEKLKPNQDKVEEIQKNVNSLQDAVKKNSAERDSSLLDLKQAYEARRRVKTVGSMCQDAETLHANYIALHNKIIQEQEQREDLIRQKQEELSPNQESKYRLNEKENSLSEKSKKIRKTKRHAGKDQALEGFTLTSDETELIAQNASKKAQEEQQVLQESRRALNERAKNKREKISKNIGL